MFLTNLFIQKCTHEKVTPEQDSAYCPDCGKLIKNEWYIARCACCGVKLKAMTKKGKITTQSHYCYNCGSAEYKVEKLEQINFIDIKFAVLVKSIVEENRICSTTRCWQEKTSVQPKLLAQYL